MEHIKVNFPICEKDFYSGNGEGMWVIVDDNVKKKYDNDDKGGSYTGILDNDSMYYPKLKVGAKVTFELRGKNRPVALIKDFLENYEAISEEELHELKMRIVLDSLFRRM